MSSIVAQFDPATSNTSSFTAPNSAANGALVFFNESNVSLDLTFADGSEMYLPAWYHRHKCGATGSVNVSWDIHQTLSSLAPPISEIIVEAFAQGEAFPADGPLVRQANIGNTINTVGGTASSVQNDANTAGTSVVEATVQGDSASAVSLTNQGRLSLGTAANDGELTITCKGGTLQVTVDANGHLTVDAGIIANLITAESLNDIGMHVQAGNRVVETVNGVDTFSVSSAGPNLLAGTLSFLVGSISRISMFTAAVTTSPTFFNHGLGVVPDIVLLQPTGGVSATRTVLYNNATMTTTQVNLTANGSFSTVGLAIKF